MKKSLKSLIYGVILAVPCAGVAQTFTENFGSVTSNSSVAQASVGFANPSLIFTSAGTNSVTVRNTSPSSGYAAASGSANIFFAAGSTKTFEISGVNTSALTSPVLSFGILKSTNGANGSTFTVEINDPASGTTYTPLVMPVLPTGGGTAIWHYRTVTGTIPSVANLKIRFSNSNDASFPSNFYRIDDVKLADVCTASITAGGATSFCSGGSVLLSAPTATAYLWSNGATTQTISANLSGSYNVTITTASGCTASAVNAVNVLVSPAPIIGASASPSAVCSGATTSLTARTFARELFFSEYVEGTSFEKYVEIYNGTGATVNLSNYEYRAYHNGASTPNFTVNLGTITSTLADGAVLVIKSTSATGYPAGNTSTVVQHNGNDALVLFNTATSQNADIFGVIGQDPGAGGWTGAGGYSTTDKTLRRKSSVYSGVTVNTGLSGQSGFSTLVPEWDLFNVNDVTGLGAHTMNGSYTWLSGTTPSTGNVVTANPSSSTVYTLNANFAVSGCSASSTVQVNVLAAPVIDEIDLGNFPVITLCYDGQCTNLTALVAGGSAPYTYSWSSGSTLNPVTVCPTVSTSYTVTVKDANGCSVNGVANIQVINACCNGTNVLVCSGSETLCVDSANVAGLVLGGATVGSCPSARMAGNATGIAKNNSLVNTAQATAYPNPFNNNTTFEVTLKEKGNIQIEVMDYTGKKVAGLGNSAFPVGTHKFDWNGNSSDGSTLVDGLYFVRISTGNSVQTLKVQKQ